MARKNIQGITIEIGGETTKLQTALKGVESKLKDTQNALKDTNRLLKLDPGNVELLTQKQKLLTDAIDGTKDKLNVLRDAQEQMKAAGQVDTAEYDALQREIIETEQQLSSLTDEMREFGSVTAQQVANAGEKIKDVGGKIEAVGTAMTKYVTGPIVALGTASVAAFNEVDEGLDIIIKKTGATGDALADMQERAKNLATSIPTDFNTAGTAIGEVNTRFGLVGEELEELAGKFIKFAELNGTDVNASIDNVQAAMEAFGVETDSAADVLDILNKAAQDTGVDVNKLTSDLTSNAAALQEMGFGINTATGFLAKLNKSGLDSSAVLTGMKKAQQNAIKNGESLETALNRMQKAIMGAKDETKAMQIATELFGAKAAPALVSAIRDGRLSFDELTNTVTEWGDSVDDTFAATLDPIDEFKTALNELKIVGMDLVEAAAPMIKGLADGLKTAISDVRRWWEGLSPMAQQTIVKAAAIAAAIGPVLVVVGKVVSAVGGLMTLAPKITGMITTVKTALSGLWTVMAANPIGLIIAGVTALVAAFVYFWNTSEEFRQFWIDLWNGIVEKWNAAKEAIAAGWNALCDKARESRDGIANAWHAAADRVQERWGALRKKAGEIWDGIRKAVSEAAERTNKVLEEKWDRIKGAYEKHGGGLKGIAAATWQALKEYWTMGFDVLNALTGGKLDGIKKAFQDAWGAVTGFVRDAIEKIKSFFRFEWELPKIKLPHFSIQGKFSLNPPQVPHLGVEWYRKAMQDGMILTSPTILPAANGGMRGYGDAGPEAVVGVSSLRNMINSAVAAAVPKGGAARNLTVIMAIDGREFARTEVPYLNDEVTRVGVQLAKA